jgi:hypothetical protein
VLTNGAAFLNLLAGSIAGFDSAQNLTNVPGGTNGHVLTYDDTTATKAKWTAATGGLGAADIDTSAELRRY